jgi:hypothetical protein
MNDMSSVIVPKSDQINADDLIPGPQTITIRDVQIRGGQEQPVSIFFEGSDKAYRPCKSMSRVLVAAWGADAKAYIGRSLTLYRDPTVKWGGLEVGGIRISHLSDIENTMTMALTATKGSRKPYTVKPLTAAPAATSAGFGAIHDAIRACNTQAALRQWWTANGEAIPDIHYDRVLAAFNDRLAAVKARSSQPAVTDGSGEATTPEAGAAAAPDFAEGRGDEDMGEHDPFRLAADRLIADARTREIVADLVLKGKGKDDFDALPDELQIEVGAAIQAQRQKLEAK